jgi:hypothetical protein
MSQRQLHFNTLSSEERILQEEWARHQLTITGCCVAGYDWVRKEKGYRCLGGNHCVTDALLAEGDGGFYSGSNGGRRVKKGESEFWEGPYYKKRGGFGGMGANNGGVGGGPRMHRMEVVMSNFEKRLPRTEGIPSGEGIPGEVLGIGHLEPGEGVHVSSSSRRRRNGGADDPQLVEYNR